MIDWFLHTVKVSDIKEYRHNPRTIQTYDFEQLEKGIAKFGLIDKLICNADMTLIGGHQRLAVLKKNKVENTDVWQPKSLLDESEVRELCVRLNRNHGEFDFDLLANEFEVEDLLDWGFHADELGIDIDEKSSKPLKYKIDIEFSSLSDIESASSRISELLQDYEGSKLKIKV